MNTRKDADNLLAILARHLHLEVGTGKDQLCFHSIGKKLMVLQDLMGSQLDILGYGYHSPTQMCTMLNAAIGALIVLKEQKASGQFVAVIQKNGVLVETSAHDTAEQAATHCGTHAVSNATETQDLSSVRKIVENGLLRHRQARSNDCAYYVSKARDLRKSTFAGRMVTARY